MSSSNQRSTCFESFANELLLDLLEYLPIVDLFHAFYGLNTRFNILLLKYFRKYHLDLRSISKDDFESISGRLLPHITDRVLSLYLSDDDVTPNQIHCFISCDLPIRRLTALRSLTLNHLRSSELMIKIIKECQCLPTLNHLNFVDCYFRTEYEAMNDALNDLWRLPQLTHCYMDISFFSRVLFIVPSVRSATLQSLSIESYAYSLNRLIRLFTHSPSLRYLSVLIEDDASDWPLTFSLSHLITLKLFVTESSGSMMNLLRSTPNLRSLTVKTDAVNMNGHVWQRIIVDHLPNLKVFRLMMTFRLNDNDNKENHADQLLDSFRTSFWLETRRWFVRCDWNRCKQCDDNNVYLYTLPYPLKHYFIHDAKFCSRSTRSWDDDDISSYDRVHSLAFALPPSTDTISPYFRFSELRHLDVDLPFDENLYSTITRFDRLTTVRVTLYDSKHILLNSSQLKDLFDRMPHLTSFQIDRWTLTCSPLPLHELVHNNINRLHLQTISQYYTHEQCKILSNSPIGRQCQFLSIAVENRFSIIELINDMIHLQAINVICHDDTWTPERNEDEDELVQWLQGCLMYACIITRGDDSIWNEEHKPIKSLRVWIR